MPDITDWLERHGLGKYASKLLDHSIDFDVLPQLSDDDLKEVGFTIGDRHRLRIAMQASASEPETIQRTATQDTENLLQQRQEERRQVTVLFCDLVDSTALSNSLDIEDYRDLLRNYQDACAGVAARFSGFVAKFMGDGVLIYFGWPRAHEDDAERAIHASLAILEAVKRLGSKADASPAVRIGLATGQVIIGDLVGEQAFETAAISGEPPNLASRLQSLAAPNTVVISDVTHSLAGSLFLTADLGDVDLKGFDTPVRAWRVDAEQRVHSRFDATHHDTMTPLIGREEELDLLKKRWDQARSGQGQVVLLSGEAGIGKSRLVSALRQHIGSQGHVFLGYQCLANHSNSALFPVITQMQMAAGFEPGDKDQQKLEKLEILLEGSGLPLSDQMPRIAPLIGVSHAEKYKSINVSPMRGKQLGLAALLAHIAGLSEEAPVLMHFEDVHWIDPTSKELLDLIVARATDLRALVIITFRPDFVPDWRGEAHVTTQALRRLDARNSAEMAKIVVDATGLPNATVQQIVERSDGIPLFVEEITRAVVAQRASKSSSGNSHVPIIPATLADSLMARLDALGPAKEIAQTASVIGRRFDPELLADVTQQEAQSALTALDQLLDSQLIVRRPSSLGIAYEFRHALFQDLSYQSLMKRRRRELHLKIADVIEARFPDLAQPEILAHHRREAGSFTQAAQKLLEAGRQAIKRSANVEAETYLRQGLALLDRISNIAERNALEIELQNAMGVCLAPLRGQGSAEVSGAYSRAAELSEALGNKRGLFIALRGKGQYNMVSGNICTACTDTHRILELACELKEREFDIEAHHLGWSALCMNGDYETSNAHAEVGIDLYERSRDHYLTYVYSGHDPGCCCRSFGSMSLAQLGRPDQALHRCREGIELAESLDHPFSVVIALWAEGTIHRLRQEPEQLAAIGERIILICNERGTPALTPVGEVFIGDALAQSGERSEGLAMMRRGIDCLLRTSTALTVPSFYAFLAEALLEQGKIADGLEAVEEGLALSEKGGDRFNLPQLHRVKAKLMLASNASATFAAEQVLNAALKIAKEQKSPLLHLRVALDLSTLWAGSGEWERASELLRPAFQAMTEGFGIADVDRAARLLEELK